MTDKKVKHSKKESQVVEVVPATVQTVPQPTMLQQPVKVEMVERLTEADKAVLDLAKSKRETALEKAKTALAQSEVAELAYNNVILQLALRYHLVDGDVINEDGTIKRI